MKELYEQFKKEKLYLENLSPRTIKYFEYVFMAWEKYEGGFPTGQTVKDWVIKLSESGISPFTINSYIRGFNSFLTWLHENGHAEHIKIKKIKTGKRSPKVYTETELKRLLSYKPKTVAQERTYTLICLLIDCGIRIDEALSLRRSKVDLDNLLITVTGKGDKERIVPISLECRKQLYKFLRRHEFDLVFATHHGDKLTHSTSLKQLHEVCGIAGIDKGGWHKFRHSFATNYLKNGGNLVYLQRVLGHEDISVTKLYVDENIEDLSMMQKRTSLLGRLK
jgi:integrase/recombinase XerD